MYARAIKITHEDDSHVAVSTASIGASCKCLSAEDVGLDLHCDDGPDSCMFEYAIVDGEDECVVYEAPADYGIGCKAHDEGLAPFCPEGSSDLFCMS